VFARLLKFISLLLLYGVTNLPCDASALVKHPATDLPPSRYLRPTSRSGPFKNRVIVFVHGIFGDAQSTWTASNSAYWPRLLLGDSSFNDSDIYVASYSSPYFGGNYTVSEIVASLDSQFTRDGVFAKHREVIFVCHSLGGIVVQEFLRTFQKLAVKVPFVYFFAVPEEGAQVVKIARIFNADPLLKILVPDGDLNAYVQDLQNGWLAARFTTHRFCAYEKKAYPLLGIIVDRSSSTRACDELPVPIDENHVDIVKPKNREHQSYTALLNAVKTFPIAAKPTPPSKPPFQQGQAPDEPSVAKIRADATSLIHRLYKSASACSNDLAWWGSVQLQDGSGVKGIPYMYKSRLMQFADEYNETYRKEIVSTRSVLMGNVRHLPFTDPRIERLYRSPPEEKIPGWPTTPVSLRDVSDQLCDLRNLLNELERENNLELSGGELKINCSAVMQPQTP
jgi:hypothetical protein